jgi:hypothetical protein
MKLIASICLAFVATSAILASGLPRKLLEKRSYDHGWESDMGALDLLSNTLHDETDTTGLILVYGAKRGLRGDVERRIGCMKNYMTQRRGIPSDRIRVLRGGYRQEATIELWVVPTGAAAPTATPTLRPRDIRFKKRGLKYTCDV